MKNHPLTAQQLAMEFVLWAEARDKEAVPSDAPAVMHRFDCSKATAYRLIQAYRDAKKLPELEYTDSFAKARQVRAEKRAAA